jgi:SAM-dependent methyltransferase
MQMPELPESGPDLLALALRNLPPQARIIDYGCYGWSAAAHAAAAGRDDLEHIGVDLHAEPPGRPPNARFSLLSAMGAPLQDGNADLVVAANVLEHCTDAVGVFGTLLAAAKPGGLVYVEAPSEFTLFEKSDPDVEGQGYSSFWDDPTHVRPWPPAALYRLGLSYGARPEACHYAFRAGLHSGIALIRRIDPGPPRYRYVSLFNCPRGVDAALAHVERGAGGVPTRQPDLPM